MIIRVNGYPMSSHVLDRFAALVLWRMGLLEAFEQKLIKQLCSPGMQVLDIGANIGFHTLQMSAAVGPAGRVWAFEPDPGNFNTLQQNLARNGCSNVRAVQAAVSSRTETITLYRSTVHNGDHRIYNPGEQDGGAVSVQAVALGEFFNENQVIDLIKMDIQGAEGLALAGMERILKASPNLVILMEFWPSAIEQTGCSPDEILQRLRMAGFRIFALLEKPGTLVEIANPQDFIGSIANQEYRNLLVSRNQPVITHS